MAAIYIHIPFCKQACHYCDFHFSTSLKKKEQMIESLCVELALRKEEAGNEVEAIYFGGGTPSLLSVAELRKLLDVIDKTFSVSGEAEITLEANPDDLSENLLQDMSGAGINRLSIGIQSFREEDLKLLNRAHSREQAIQSLAFAKKFFENISVDLIYGIPYQSKSGWRDNLVRVLDAGIPHISCYALTVEPKTALEKFIEKGAIEPKDEDLTKKEYELLLDLTETAGYVNYEFSNFGKPGYFSRNNTAYWTGKSYLGIGPSAHSYDGNVRAWNIANNSKYIAAISQGQLPTTTETLTTWDRYNEYIMTRLRTMDGISLKEVRAQFGEVVYNYMRKQAQPHLQRENITLVDEHFRIHRKAKFLTDGIASDLFLVNLAQ